MQPPMIIPVPGLAEAQEELAPSYQAYLEQGFDGTWAISLPTAAYALALARHVGATHVADFGSGFTSIVLGIYGQQTGAQVDSIDDSPGWLSRTAGALREAGLGGTGHRLTLMSSWSVIPSFYDLIVYDFASGATRDQHMGKALSSLVPGGVILFDDAQSPEHNETAHEVVAARGGQIVDLRDYTLDGIGRWALLGVGV